MTAGGSGADDERITRNGRPGVAAPAAMRARIAWCIVGTAVYQVGAVCAIQSKNSTAENAGVHTLDAPAASDDSSPPTRP